MGKADLAKKIGVTPDAVSGWEETGSISKKEADELASATRTTYGYLLMPTAPDDDLQVADFRTVNTTTLKEPSPELFDTLMAMLRRRTWAHEERVEIGRNPLEFAGSRNIETSTPEDVAGDMRTALGLAEDWQAQLSQDAARKLLFERMDHAGIVVCVNGIVRNNTHRPLDLEEFRGFSLADSHAPVVFVNGNDSLSGQLLTLAHEFAHIVIGQGGVSSWDFEAARPKIETFCNKAAAGFLVPQASLRLLVKTCEQDDDVIPAVANKYCVSPIVAIYRLKALKLISAAEFQKQRSKYASLAATRMQPSDRAKGGAFWNTQTYRIGPSFGKEVVQAFRAGKIFHREAWSLAGLSGKIFEKYASTLSEQLP